VSRVNRSLALSFAEKYTNAAVAFISVIVLARLLTPEDIGVFSVAAAITALAHVLRDFGVASYIVQEKELTPARLQSAFTATLLVSWSLALVLVASSGPLSAFYAVEGLQSVLLLLSVNFVIVPLTSPILGVLRRELRFGALYAIKTAGVAVHGITGITLAAIGHGFLSVAWASVAGLATSAVIAQLLRPASVRLVPNFTEMRRVAGFGVRICLIDLIGSLGTHAADLVLGRTLGMAAVGVYSRAYGLISLFHRDFMSAVQAVAFPAYAATHREGQELKVPFLASIAYLTVIGWPFYAFVALFALPVLRLLFGPQWDAAAPLVQLLAIAGVIGACWALSRHVLMAMGRAGEIAVAETYLNVFQIACIGIGAWIDLWAVAAAQILTFGLGFALYYRLLARTIGIATRDFISALSRSAGVTAVSAIGAAAVKVVLDSPEINPWLLVPLAGSAWAIGWLVGVHVFGHPIRNELAAAARRFGIFLRVSPPLRAPWHSK
jgi:O-antigen/teichoic acid export membrane protein